MTEELTNSDFAEFVRNMRKAAKMTQAELGEAIEITPATICRWEKRMNMPSDIDFSVAIIRDAVKRKIREQRRKTS
ncbi:helix-turn-helix transcriptional regulator [Bacillaceae bacterium Marseille-Q3522]|nr:helix-turn-helix transcriptional regulator [Bacillaceae bacterium Marseille-Q3522]